MVAERRVGIADEPIAIQVGGKAGAQPVHINEFPLRRNLQGQRLEQLPKRGGLHIHVGDAGSLPRDAKELDLHNGGILKW